MSPSGYKQTSSRPKSMSALPPKADILMVITDFRLCRVTRRDFTSACSQNRA